MTRVLVMDDDDVLRSALRVILEGAGYEVADAADGAAGVRLYREHGADLVLVDIFMPTMDGLEVIRALRTEVPRPKLVAMSGGGGIGPQDILRMAAALGAERTLTKPFVPTELLGAVRDVLWSDVTDLRRPQCVDDVQARGPHGGEEAADHAHHKGEEHGGGDHPGGEREPEPDLREAPEVQGRDPGKGEQ